MTRTRPDWLRREYVRAYVFACSHSSRHQRVQVCRTDRGVAVWGQERPFLLSPSAPPPPRELCASRRLVPGSDPLAQVSGPGQLRSRAVFSSLTPHPRAVRPLGVHSRVRPATTQPAPGPRTLPVSYRCPARVFSPPLSLSLNAARIVTPFPHPQPAPALLGLWWS